MIKLSLRSNCISRQSWENWINSRGFEYFTKFDLGSSNYEGNPYANKYDNRDLFKKLHAFVDRQLINKRFNEKSSDERSNFMIFAHYGGFSSSHAYNYVGLIKPSILTKPKFRSKIEFVSLFQGLWSNLTDGGTLDMATLEPGDTVSQLSNLLAMCDHYILSDHFSLTSRSCRDAAAWKREEGIIHVT